MCSVHFRTSLGTCTVHLTLLPQVLQKLYTPSNVWQDTRSLELLPSLQQRSSTLTRSQQEDENLNWSSPWANRRVSRRKGYTTPLSRVPGGRRHQATRLSDQPGSGPKVSPTCFLATRECDETRSPKGRDSSGQEGVKDSFPLAFRCPWIHHPHSHVTRVIIY